MRAVEGSGLTVRSDCTIIAFILNFIVRFFLWPVNGIVKLTRIGQNVIDLEEFRRKEAVG